MTELIQFWIINFKFFITTIYLRILYEAKYPVLEANLLFTGGFYIILPQMHFAGIKYDYPDARPATPGFEYHSGNKNKWLTIEDTKHTIIMHLSYPHIAANSLRIIYKL